MTGYNHILVAGDGTLLVSDDTLTQPLPVAQVLPADHPLRCAAELILARPEPGAVVVGLDPALTVRLVRAPRGQLSAVEVRVPDRPFAPLPLGSWLYPADPAELGWVPGLAMADGLPASDVASQTGTLLLPDVPAFLAGIRELFSERRAMRDLRLVRRGDSRQIRTVRLYGWIPDGEPGTLPIGITIDITELSSVPEESARFFQALISVAPDTVMVVDVARDELLWTNGRLPGQLGYPDGQLSRWADIRRAVHWSDRAELDAIIGRLRVGEQLAPVDLRFRIRDGAGDWRWMHSWLTPWLSDLGRPGGSGGRVEQIVATFRDVDESVRAEQRLQWEARHDPLTGLANRRVINETLQHATEQPEHPLRHVYFVDVDDFKKVNDALGHSAGDELLRTLAARVAVLVQPGDVVGRFGGDELIIVSAQAPAALAPRLLAAVRERSMLTGSEITVTCSIGAATIVGGESPGEVIHRANDAMYRAKRAGRDRYEIAGPLDTGPAQQRVEVEASLRRAVMHGGDEIDMAFQPIVDAELRPVAAEALLRWRHPTRGPMLPAEFLPVAEAAGLMTELGELIMTKSLTAAAGWAAAGHPLPVSVNVGSRQLGTGELERLLVRLLAETRTPPELLCLEVTESMLVDADSPELAELCRLRALGLQIALDDFGTGYSPLSYLKRLPATTIKLDQSFVAGLDLAVPDPVDVAIARAVLRLGSEIGMRVVAEGVESEQQLRRLTELGYRYFQGFWAYPPMPAAALGALLARANPLTPAVE